MNEGEPVIRIGPKELDGERVMIQILGAMMDMYH